MNPVTRSADLRERVCRVFRELPTRPDDLILVACSGGPDSTALLHLTASLRDELGVRAAAAWMDHGIRPPEERSAERELVGRMTERLGLILREEELPAGELERIAREEGTGLEDAARRKRYAFLERTAQELGADWIALGHTRDDQLETLVMRFFQGSGSRGLSGIPERRGRIIRPLLSTSRQEIMAFLSSAEIPFHFDTTNRELRHLRNRVRHELLPVIRQVFPGYPTALLSLADKMRIDEGFLDERMRERWNWEPWGEGWCTDYRDFASLAPAVRIRTVFDLYARAETGTPGARLPFRFLQPVVHLDPEGKDRILLRGYGAVLEKRGVRACFRKDIVQTGEMGYHTVLTAGVRYALAGTVSLTVECGVLLPGESTPWIRTESTRPPLIARSPGPGDRMSIGTGRKEVRKLLSEWMVPPDLRQRIPVIEDREGILAVLGEPYGYRNRFAPRARLGAAEGETVFRFRFDKKG